MPTKIADGEKIVFIGDSITDCGRRGGDRPLGNGYVSMVAGMLLYHDTEKSITIVNQGISGDRVTGLTNRWTDDVINEKPDWLSIKIGINDMHGHLFGDDTVSPDNFAKHYRGIVERTRTELPECRLLLIDPFFMSKDRSPGSTRADLLNLLPAYSGTVEALAKEFGAMHVRTQTVIERLLTRVPTEAICGEPVHPYAVGHLAIALAVYEALS